MFTSFEELTKAVKEMRQVKGIADKLGQELAADIVKEVKTLGPDQTELRKVLNNERIKALGLTLVQGGKE